MPFNPPPVFSAPANQSLSRSYHSSKISKEGGDHGQEKEKEKVQDDETETEEAEDFANMFDSYSLSSPRQAKAYGNPSVAQVQDESEGRCSPGVLQDAVASATISPKDIFGNWDGEMSLLNSAGDDSDSNQDEGENMEEENCVENVLVPGTQSSRSSQGPRSSQNLQASYAYDSQPKDMNINYQEMITTSSPYRAESEDDEDEEDENATFVFESTTLEDMAIARNIPDAMDSFDEEPKPAFNAGGSGSNKLKAGAPSKPASPSINWKYACPHPRCRKMTKTNKGLTAHIKARHGPPDKSKVVQVNKIIIPPLAKIQGGYNLKGKGKQILGDPGSSGSGAAVLKKKYKKSKTTYKKRGIESGSGEKEGKWQEKTPKSAWPKMSTLGGEEFGRVVSLASSFSSRQL